MSSAVPIPLDQVPVISLKGVTKTYTFYEAPSARLYALLQQTLGAKNSDGRKFTAVQGIDLEIMPGECVGIIGRNGAGKSTLLQMIAGTLQPSSGTIQVRGRVAALLELGSGFNPEFTGRENIHLNAAILGLTKKEVAAKFDDIVAYSGIAEFIDQPVRTYSSGMSLRLAFSVCVHVDADILIIDEALAVGDARFQFKCHATLDQMRAAGKTIIFVSHDTNSVKRMCKTALLLERGEALIKGSPNDVTNLYTKLITSPHGVEAIRTDIEALRNLPLSPLESEKSSITSTAMTEEIVSEVSAEGVQLIVEERDHQQISDKEYSYGGERGVITDVLLQDEKKQPRLSFIAGVRMSIRLRCKALEDVIDPIYAITIKDVKGTEVFGTNTYFQDLKTAHVRAGAETQVSFELTLNLLPGVFFISAGWVRLENAEVQVIHRRYDVVRFDVLPRDRSFGVAYCPTKIIVEPIANSPA